MDEHIPKTLRVSLLQLTDVLSGGQCNSVTWLRKIHDAETNEERNCGDDFEVE